MDSNPPVALLFGGSGQIGAPLLLRLRDAGWRLIALSRQAQRDADGLHWLRGDFDRTPALPSAVDSIFSCGPLDHFARWHAQAGIEVARVVAFGSTSVHVKQVSGDAHERDLAARLRQAEATLSAIADRRGIATTLLRPTLVYGSCRDASLSRIAAMATRYGRFLLPRRADGLRQPVHADDLADAAIAAHASAAARGRSYDLPGGETLAYREMVARVLASLDPPRPLHELPMPLFRGLLAMARMRGIAGDLSDDALRRMRQDLVFDAAPAMRDFGYAPRMFRPDAAMFDPP